jgi:hypothetical protein
VGDRVVDDAQGGHVVDQLEVGGPEEVVAGVVVPRVAVDELELEARLRKTVCGGPDSWFIGFKAGAGRVKKSTSGASDTSSRRSSPHLRLLCRLDRREAVPVRGGEDRLAAVAIDDLAAERGVAAGLVGALGFAVRQGFRG